MMNLAGPSYDFGNVLFAVLQECEHRRRGLLANEAERALYDVARAKLEQVHKSYLECGGGPEYWRELESEVLQTAMPQYVAASLEQTRLERTNYDLWRRGDPVARACWAVGALAVGGIIVWLPFIPIFEDAFAFLAAAGGIFYPEIKRTYFDFRHSRALNRLITGAEAYQKNRRIHYMTNAEVFDAFRGTGAPAPPADAAPADAAPPGPPSPAVPANTEAAATPPRQAQRA
jgi:hypothetical protein